MTNYVARLKRTLKLMDDTGMKYPESWRDITDEACAEITLRSAKFILNSRY